ncbi:homocysteine S-methyltransferase [Streptomyces sp. NPDC048606]|uniref:homocysteine S-methyltransferase n=1 Tax=Streptomyces sp. NPDC048606 TaxID=3154726 RepID=UPI0034388272
MPRATRPLADALAVGPVLLDGGLAERLAAQGCDLSGVLWTGRVLAEHPEQVEAAHTAYVEAGAEVLITASYQTGHDPALSAASVRLADRAARAAGHEVWVAASVGPYGAALADGSEYRGRYGLGGPRLEAFHRPRVEALLAAGPDVLALETLPDTDEARALLRVLAASGARAWVSYTVEGDRTRAGQPLDEAFALAAAAPEVIAVGVNCCDPRDVLPALETAASVTTKPLLAYPNDGSVWEATTATWHRPRTPPPWPVDAWLRTGARIVGGCCRVGPSAVAALRPALRRGSGAG